MASIRDYAVTIYSAATASMVCEMPVHESGDLLVAFVNKDSASNFTTPGTWTAQQTQTSAGAAGGVYTKRAASSSETVTFALTAETCCAVVIAVKDCNGTTEADAISGSAKSGADDSTLPLAGVGITPSHDNCLILHGLSTDSGIGPNALPPWVNLFAGDAGANSLCVAYTHQKTAAAITAPNHWAGAQDDSRGFIIAIRPAGTNDTFDAYLPLSTTPARQISPLNGSTGVVDKGTYRTGAGIAITSVAGKTVSGVTVATTADSGINPFRGSMRNAGSSSTTNLNHTELPLTSSEDLSDLGTNLVFGTFLNLAPRDYVDTGSPAQGGKYIIVGTTTSDWRAWVVGGQFSATERSDARNNYLIDVSSAATIYGSAGAFDETAVIEFAFGSAGYYGAPSVLWNELYAIGVVTLAGGSSFAPFNFDNLIFAVNNGCGILPLMQQAGALATMWAPIKFGGVDPIFVRCNLNTFQYPRVADEIDFVDFHVPANVVGIEFDGQDRGSGDVDILHFTNCLFTSPSSYYWRFASTHDAGADIDFSGASVVGALVTLRSTVSLDRVTFIDCSSITQNGATLTNCNFQNTKVNADNIEAISDASFTSGGTGHGIEITSNTGSPFDLTNVEFSGYGADGTTDAAIYNNSGGAVTLNIIGGTTPTVRNGAGASTTLVINPVTVTVNVKDADTGSNIQNARVLLETSDNTQLPYEESVTITRSGSTATVTHTAHGMLTGDKVVIRGANEHEYNGVYTITVSDANTYTYTVSGTPATPATGTIVSSFVVLSGLTDVNGNISATRSYGASQPVKGTARKGSSAPFFKPAGILGTVSNSAATAFNVQLISDD